MNNIEEICLWAAAYYGAYFNGREVRQLQSMGLLTHFWDMTQREFLSSIDELDINLKLKEKLKRTSREIDRLRFKGEALQRSMEALDIFIVSEEDSDFPYYWKKLSGMPKLVFAKGRREVLEKSESGSCAVVGSRTPSAYSLQATRDMVRDMAAKDITIVSGMALGIDRAAHLQALNSGGPTIAFLAGGPDNVYPWANKDIYDSMTEKGLIISEMPPGTKAQKQYFPSRNRLISAISDCCLVMEAGSHSGTLHTASFAAAYGKEVYVLPNTIYSEFAMGGLRLINDGANILLKSGDVIQEIAERSYMKLIEKGVNVFDDTKEELSDDVSVKKAIEEILSVKPKTSDELVAILKQPYFKVSALLSEMEINGRVTVEHGKFVLTIFKQ